MPHLSRPMDDRRNFPSLSPVWGICTGVVALCLVLVFVGCQVTSRPKPGTVPEPTIRVRIASGLEHIVVQGQGPIRLTPMQGTPPGSSPGSTPGSSPARQNSWTSPTALTIRRRLGAFILESPGQRPLKWPAQAILLQPLGHSYLTVGSVHYPHQLVLYSESSEDRFDVVNQLPIEQYLPGVLDRELPKAWSLATFEAQAIAARSYALERCSERRDKPFDVESTVVSQVYGGLSSNPKSQQAVAKTRGQVLTFQKQILPAYYSSCCGGVGQDAAVAFPGGLDISPLRGQPHGGWCSASKNYRWGPVLFHKAHLARRIAAWGRANRHRIAALQWISDMRVSAYNSAGRPARFTITDPSRGTYDLAAEQFRFACNTDTPDLPKLSKDQQLKSSFVSIYSTTDTVSFSGRGYGHGVGLCQWGAQGLAQKGYTAAAILAFYYSQTKIEQLY